MTTSADIDHRSEGASPPASSRRRFLYIATGLFGTAGLVAATWPLLDQMNPDMATRAKWDELAVDIADLEPGEQRIVRWRNFPILIARRSDAALAWLRDHPGGLRPANPVPIRRRQPASAENPSRSIDPGLGVFADICTWCGCSSLMQATAIEPDVPGGFFCPCCASRYDAAGRPTSGIAQRDLLVPPYAYEGTLIVLGKHRIGEPVPGEFFDHPG